MSPVRDPAVALGRPARRGMTLVELLVVTGLISVFLGLVVVGVRGGRQQPKRAADDLASMLMSAQARALGVPEGAAVILASGTGPGGAACTSAYDAEMQPLIEATVTGLPPGDPSSTTASVTVTPLNGAPDRAYKILFFGRDGSAAAPPTAWMEFVPQGTVNFRVSAGQTASNTVWPRPPGGGALNGLLAQYPVKSSALVVFDASAAVDLRFSGIGDDRTAAYGRFDGMGAIAVVFDRVGRVSDVLQQVPEPGAAPSAGAQPAVPLSPIYFLLAPRTEIDAGANTLNSSEAQWVAVAPQTGRIFVSENVPQSGTDMTALRAARAKARQGVAIGR